MFEVFCVDATEDGGNETSDMLPLEEFVRKRVRGPPVEPISEFGKEDSTRAVCGICVASFASMLCKDGEPLLLLECVLPERDAAVDRDGSLRGSSRVAAVGRVERERASRAPMTGLVEGTDLAKGLEGRSEARLSRSPSTLSKAPTQRWAEDEWESPGSSSMSKRGDLRYVLSDMLATILLLLLRQS